jgi:hypothetical protein
VAQASCGNANPNLRKALSVGCNHMKTTKSILTIGLILSFVSCGETIKNKEKGLHTIQKVTIAFSGYGCEGTCPFKAFSIDQKLGASYYGGPNADKSGYFKGKLTQTIWDSVQIRFDKIYSDGIDTTEYSKTDHPDVELYITTNSNRKYFKKNTGEIIRHDLDILYWFIDLASKTSSLKRCDTLNFETSLQYQFIK